MATQENPGSPILAIVELLAKCERLCDHGRSVIASTEIKSGTFIFRSLRDAVEQLEVILRMFESEGEGHDKDEPRGLFSRITRGLRKREGEEEEEEAEGAAPHPRFAHNSLEGTSWTIPVAELLGFLAFGRKTGVLWVDAADENYLIGLKDGDIVHATSTHTPEGLRLGEVLVGFGYLTRRQLERFLAGHSEGTDPTGEALLRSGMISEEELRNALLHQAQQLINRLVKTRHAMFRFREGMLVDMAFKVQMNTTQALLESARYHDENRSEEEDDSWSAWNAEILSELSKLAAILPSTEVPAEATEEEGQETISGEEASHEAPQEEGEPGEPQAALPAENKAKEDPTLVMKGEEPEPEARSGRGKRKKKRQ